MEQHVSRFGIVQILGDGGPFMWLVLCISVVSIVLVVERYLALRFRYGIDGRQLFNEVKKYIAQDDSRRALDVCRQYPTVPLAQVLASGVQQMESSQAEIDVAMEAETLFYIPKINERLQYLPSLANTCTLIGLLGTIVGLILAFGASDSAATALGGLTKEEALAQGISYAMYTTAAALAVAIPTVLAAMFLSAKANRLIDDIDHYASSLKHLIQKKKNGSLDSEEKGSKKARAGSGSPAHAGA